MFPWESPWGGYQSICFSHFWALASSLLSVLLDLLLWPPFLKHESFTDSYIKPARCQGASAEVCLTYILCCMPSLPHPRCYCLHRTVSFTALYPVPYQVHIPWSLFETPVPAADEPVIHMCPQWYRKRPALDFIFNLATCAFFSLTVSTKLSFGILKASHWSFCQSAEMSSSSGFDGYLHHPWKEVLLSHIKTQYDCLQPLKEHEDVSCLWYK